LRGATYFGLAQDETASVQPEIRLQLNRRSGPNQLSLSLESISSRSLELALFPGGEALVDPVLTYRADLAWQRRLRNRAYWRIGAFFQLTPDDYAFILADNTSREILHSSELLGLPPELPAPTAGFASRNYGLELTICQPAVGEGWYYTANATVFRSEHENRSGEWTQGRFSQDFAIQLVTGREWSGRDRKERRRALGLNLSLLSHGGERFPPVNAQRRNFPNLNDYWYAAGRTDRIPVFFRPDLRLYKRKFHRKTTTTLALDIQNVAGITNVAHRYFDDFAGASLDREQLGLIPVLSYRIEWRY